jgi:hypothetical protein
VLLQWQLLAPPPAAASAAAADAVATAAVHLAYLAINCSTSLQAKEPIVLSLEVVADKQALQCGVMLDGAQSTMQQQLRQSTP